MVRHFLNQLTNNDFCIFENLHVYPTVSLMYPDVFGHSAAYI